MSIIADEFDYQEGFTQLLEEAIKNSCSNTATFQSHKYVKNRKSWRKSLFSWLKADGNRKLTKKPMSGHVSGPVQKTDGGIDTGRATKAASGPITGFTVSTKRADEYEVSYMCLEQINKNTKKCCSYGPVYLVT
ncbi:hypothetical protein CASFOL_014791 [Castilleja foliolosa]|uniref:Uncharacterized protein n=1 Tax=Castilleja foliolosa TaxID=1961234 RepID=A0ABD3DBU4_9LAMI